MNETILHALRTEPPLQEMPETSDEKAWRSPSYAVVKSAIEVTAHSLGDR
jgi:hypothetical protein